MPNAEQPLPLDSYLKPSLVDVVTGPLAADDPPGFKSAVECFLVQHGRGDDYGRNLGGELIPRCWTPVRNSEDDDERLSWLAVTEYRIGIHPNTPDSMRLAVASCFAIPFEELNEVVLRLRAEQLAKQGSATVAA